MSARGTQRREERSAEQIVALAHEVGNVLAAVRMSAHLLPDGSARERRDGAGEIERWVAHAGELLALGRPIVGASREGRSRVSVAEVLEGVGHVLLQPGELPGPFEVASAPRGAPGLRVDLDALHHVLRVLVRTLFSEQPGCEVSLRAGRRGDRVEFVIAASGGDARGREALAIQIADAAVRPDRGRVTQDSTRRGTRVRVSLPASK